MRRQRVNIQCRTLNTNARSRRTNIARCRCIANTPALRGVLHRNGRGDRSCAARLPGVPGVRRTHHESVSQVRHRSTPPIAAAVADEPARIGLGLSPEDGIAVIGAAEVDAIKRNHRAGRRISSGLFPLEERNIPYRRIRAGRDRVRRIDGNSDLSLPQGTVRPDTERAFV